MRNEDSRLLNNSETLFQRRKLFFNWVNAWIQKILAEYPSVHQGLTYEQIDELYANRWHHRLRVGHRVHELRNEGLVRTRIKQDMHGRLMIACMQGGREN